MPAFIRARGALALLLALLLTVGSVQPTFADTDLELGGPAVIAHTDGDVILLRSGAGYQFTVVKHLPEGTAVTVREGPVAGDDGNLWYRIEADGVGGYVFATYLARPENAPAPAAQTNSSKVAPAATSDVKSVVGTGGDGLRLRDGADLSAAVLATMPEGATVTLTGAPRLNGGLSWYPVEYAGTSGWAVGDYLGAASSGTAAAATDRQALAITIGEHVAVSNTGGWSLRLRADAHLNAPSLDAAPEGAVLQVLDGPLSDASGNAWYAVSYDGSQGYASAAYLSWTDAELTARAPIVASGAGASVGGNAEVSSTGGWPLRIRAATGTDAATLAAAPEGAVLEILDGPILDEAGNAWYAVNYDGLTGFAGSAYLSATERPLSARVAVATVGTSGKGSGFEVGTHVEVSNTGGWNLRLRESAGLNGGVVAAADEGVVLVVTSDAVLDGEGNAWYGVNYDGLTGYVRASYLSATDRAPSARIVAEQIAAVTTPAAQAQTPAPAPAAPVVAPVAAQSTAPAAAPAAAPTPRPSTAPAPAATGSLIWPAQGTFTQDYGVNVASYGPGGHNGIDIANSAGTPIVAADGGVVTYAGWKGGLGNAIVIDHGNGMVTEYGHGLSLNVSVGQRVARGQQIMAMGSTGRSTGPHLHFSVIVNGVYRNPLNYLPGR